MDGTAYGLTYFMIILYTRVAYLWTREPEVIYGVLILGLPVMFFLEEIAEWMRKKG